MGQKKKTLKCSALETTYVNYYLESNGFSFQFCMVWSFVTRSDPILNSPNVNQNISHGVVFYTLDCKSVDIWKARPANDETKSIVTPNTRLWKLKKNNWIIQFNLFFESNESYLLEQRSFQINQRKERSLCRNKPNMNGVKKIIWATAHLPLP